jgi:hypothetical protein
MWVEAVLSKDDLVSLTAQIVPLTIRLDSHGGAAQYIELATATDLALVADQGLRMTTQARIHWPVLGITVPIKIDPLGVMIKPRIVKTRGEDALSFTLEIEHAEFAGVPAFGDRAITDKINSELRERHVDLAWAFSATLSHRFNLPALLEPLDSLALNVAWGKVRITDEAMVLAISFHAEVSRRGEDMVTSQRLDWKPWLAPRRALANLPVAYRSPNLNQIALIGGATLAAVGAYFTLRGTGRLGARLFRQAFGY